MIGLPINAMGRSTTIISEWGLDFEMRVCGGAYHVKSSYVPSHTVGKKSYPNQHQKKRRFEENIQILSILMPSNACGV